MDSNYNQKKPWMNSRGGNNGSSDNWGGFQSGRDPGPERSSLSLAGWSPYADTTRRPVATNNFPDAQQRSGTRWSRAQTEWNEMRAGGGPQAGRNSWSGPSNGDKWSDSRMMQQQQQQQQQQPEQMHGDIIEPPRGQMEGYLQGFNDAGRDWFYRYLEMGCGPEDARDRVLDRNRNHPESLDSSPQRNGRYSEGNVQVERRNISDERRRPPESRPEKPSYDLTGLSGASRKWFHRHLQSGLTPEVALAKVLEYKKNFPSGQSVQPSTATGGRKRPVEEKVIEDTIKPKKGKEGPPPPPAGGSSHRNRLTVAIVSEDHPQHVLQKQQLMKIETALTEKMKQGWTRSLNFGGIRYRPGMILVTCLDKGSKDWLEMTVPKITALKGVSLRVYKEDEVPGTKGITVYVPNDEPDEVSLGFIKEQNTDLHSKNWSVARSFKGKAGRVLTISIGEKSMRLLHKRGMSLSYRFGQLSCRLSKGPVYPARKKKALKETPKTPLEIDLTEEDADMEISNMTVLDEVQCDDEGEEVCEEPAGDELEIVEEYDNEEEGVNEEVEQPFEAEDEQ